MRIKRSRYSIIKISILRQNGGYEMDNNYDEVEYQVDNQEMEKPAVSNIRAYIMMVCGMFSWPLVFYMLSEQFKVSRTIDYKELLTNPQAVPAISYGVLYYVATGLFWSMVVAGLVLWGVEIYKIHNSGRKVVGIVLFYLLPNPVYFIWRAHVLDKKKLVEIIYVVISAILILCLITYYMINYIPIYQEVMSAYGM